VNYVVTTAKEIRGMSDMQGALEMLKRADELTPDHPAIIAEMAQTYEQMGVAAKATDNWRRIQLLGETKAGSYYELASRRLGAGPSATWPPIVHDPVVAAWRVKRTCASVPARWRVISP
jgi:predicted TPR repeat methyltransferase